jgi:hypothetical protein
MSASQASPRNMSPQDIINEANHVMDTILGFGDDVPQILTELRSMRDSAARIAVIVAKHLGVRAPGGDSQAVVLEFDANDPVAKQVFLDPTINDKERKILQAAAPRDPQTVVKASDAGHGATGPGGASAINIAAFRDILMFFVQNPQLLTLIMSLFGKQPLNKPA